jgi:hypothetical protein
VAPEITPVEIRLWRRVERGDPGDCWLWPGRTNADGYGTIDVGGRAGRRVGVHRVAWQSENGPIPLGMEVDHLCRQRRCVNPSHLALATGAENKQRAMHASAVNAAKTECINGHPFDEANTIIIRSRRDPTRSWRQCRACKKASEQMRYAKQPPRKRCRNGHLYPHGCEVNAAGARICPICGPGPRELPTHCPSGHLYDETNTYYAPGAPTKRKCRTCNRLRQAARRSGVVSGWTPG